jgi:hypothetical protein
MHKSVWALGFVAAALIVPAANAQERVPYQQRCVHAPPPFPASAGGRVTRSDLRQLVEGRTLVLLRSINVWTDGSVQGQRVLDRLGRPSHRRYSFYLRSDGSAQVRCEMIYDLGGRERACPNVQQTSGATGSTEIGVWQISEDAVCMTFTRMAGGGEICGAVQRQGGKLWLRHIRGAMQQCIDGEFELR